MTHPNQAAEAINVAIEMAAQEAWSVAMNGGMAGDIAHAIRKLKFATPPSPPSPAVSAEPVAYQWRQLLGNPALMEPFWTEWDCCSRESYEYALETEGYEGRALYTQPAPAGDATGGPPGMLQDDSRELSCTLAGKPDARMHAREAAREISRSSEHDSEWEQRWPNAETSAPAGDALTVAAIAMAAGCKALPLMQAIAEAGEGNVTLNQCLSKDQALQAIAALTKPAGDAEALAGWRFVRNSDGSVGIFAPPPKPGESPRTSDAVHQKQSRDLHELLGKLADHQAALASRAGQADTGSTSK